jgi:hypothetical protein
MLRSVRELGIDAVLLSWATVAVTAPFRFGKVFLIVLLISRMWSSAWAIPSVEAGFDVTRELT